MTWKIIIEGDGPYETADLSAPVAGAALAGQLKAAKLELKSATFLAGAFGHDISDPEKYDAFVKKRQAAIDKDRASLTAQADDADSVEAPAKSKKTKAADK